MADPLSTAGSVVGIVSLGIQVTQSLYDYYAAFKSQPSDVSHTLQKLLSLQTVLQQLLSHLTNRASLPANSELIQNIECTVQQCEECIEELEQEVEKFQKTKTDSITANLKATGRRLAYPFRQSTLHKLDEDIDDLISRLSLALSLLQQKTVDHIQDDVQDMKAVIDLIRAQQVSDEIQDWLKAPDASINFNENHKKKHPGTGLWLITGHAFATWLDQKNSVLWLKGFAGCGKSVLCSTAIQHTMRRRGFDTASRVGVAFFFFTFNDNTKQSISAMLRALILQLSGQVRGTPVSLTQLHKQHKHTTPPESSLLECLRQILLTFQDVYILLDALDESPRESHREAVLDALAEIRGWDGIHLHLLVTSRDEVDIRDALQVSSECAISLQSEGIDRDIAAFVSQHLRDNRRLHKWKDSYDEIESVLTQKAKGVFRWVECQFRDLANCPKSHSLLDKLLNSLPRTLDETYERMIQNIPSISKDYSRQMLTVLCCATRPLTILELIDAIAVDLADTSKFDTRRRLTDVDGLQELCPGFTETDFNEKTGLVTIRLAHFSVQEYLESNRISEDSHAAPFIIRKSHGHTTMASICLTFLLEPKLLALSPEEARVEFPLAEYAAQNWPYHYTESTQTESLKDRTIQLMASGDEPFHSWVQIWNVVDLSGRISRSNIPPALYYAARLGIQPVLEYLCRPENPRFKDILNAQHGEYEAPLQAAAGHGHAEAVRFLLGKGANAKATYYYEGARGSPLIAAARFGSCEVGEMLLNAGANIHGMVGYHAFQTTALEEAALRGHYDFVKWLLGNGAEVDYEACPHRALVSASLTGHLEVVKLLIDAGAQVNSKSGSDTPVAAASGRGHMEIVKLLLENGADPRLIGWLRRPPQSAFDAARENKHEQIQQLLIEWFVENVTAPTEQDISNYAMCLEEAAKSDDVRSVNLLLNWRNDYAPRGLRNDALQHPCSQGYENTVVLLFGKGIDGNQQLQHSYDYDGHSELGDALQRAAGSGHMRIVELLLAKGSEKAKFFPGPFHLSRSLQEASAGGHLEIVTLLLDVGAKFGLTRIRSGSSTGDISYKSGIIEASKTGNVDMFNLLIARGANPFQQTEEFIEALTAASTNGHPAVVRRLLDGFNAVDAKAAKYGVPLSAASAGGYQDIVEMLLENGADTKATLALQNASVGGFTEIVKLLLKHGADPNAPLMAEGSSPVGTALLEASHHGHDDIVRLLLQSGASPSAESPMKERGPTYCTPLSAASAEGHIAIVRHLLLQLSDTIIHETECTEALYHACFRGQEEIVRLLVDSGADVNAQKSRLPGYRTSLSAAVSQKHSNIVRFLLLKGARANDQVRQHTSSTDQTAHVGCKGTLNPPIQDCAVTTPDITHTGYLTAVAAAVISPETLQLLIDHGGDVNAEGDRWGTALQLAAHCEQKDSMKILLKMGAKVNSNHGADGTALQIASRLGRRDLVMLLLEAGADVNMACGRMPTALAIVCHKGGQGDLAELLLKHNANPNILRGQRGTALIAASTEGYLEMVTLLLANGAEVNFRSERYGSALTTAITERHVDIAKILLDHNADANIRGGEFYETALQAAVCQGFLDLIETLVQHGADINAKDENEDQGTALHTAIFRGRLDIVELLLRLGADPNIDGGGNVGLPLFEAISEEDYEAVKILLDHGAKTELPNGDHQNAMEAALDDGNEDIIELVKEASLMWTSGH